MKHPATAIRAHQIIECLEGRSDLVIARRGLSPDTAKNTAQQFSTLLKKSQKFLLTENIPFPQKDEKFDLMPLAANLPSDICYFERTQPEAGTWGALCFDISDCEPYGNLVPKWTCVLFVKSRGHETWGMLPIVTNVYLNSEKEIKLAAVELFEKSDSQKSPDELAFEETLSGLTRAATSEIMYFLQMLACVNVKMKTVDKPHALNKKRAQKGLSQIDSYNIIHLPVSEKPEYFGDCAVGDKRVAPRFHFRRGHIRKLSRNGLPEHLTWVSPCMVGDPTLGQVFKHYYASTAP